MELFKPLSPVIPVFLLVAVGRLRPLEKDQPGIGDGNYRLFGNSFLGFHLSRKPASPCGRYRSSGQRCGHYFRWRGLTDPALFSGLSIPFPWFRLARPVYERREHGYPAGALRFRSPPACSGQRSRRRRHQPASVIALRFPTRSCHELHSHRKVWSGSESRGVHRCLEYFFFCHHDSAGALADPLRRRSFSTGKMKVVKMQRRKIRLDSAFFSM
jgi:hypothetical protein